MYDAIIVGGRCAGAATAFRLAVRGCRVLLVDRDELPQDTLSTHLIKPLGMAYVQRWGLAEKLRELGTPDIRGFQLVKEGIRLHGTPSEASLQAYWKSAHGGPDAEASPPLRVAWAAPRRHLFDGLLLRAAAQAGAHIETGVSVQGLLHDGAGAVSGVRVQRAGGKEGELRARLVIGADGRGSRVAQHAGARTLKERPLCGFTYYAYFGAPRRLDVCVYNRGRVGVGIAPTNDGAVVAAVWAPMEWFSSFRRSPEQAYWQLMSFCAPEEAELLRACEQRGPLKGTTRMGNYILQGAGPGFALVGDAGYAIDQCTAMGMSHALRDAQVAADCLAPALLGGTDLDGALAAYEERRVTAALDYFDYVSDIAEHRLPSPQGLALLSCLASSPKDAERFLSMGAALVSCQRFRGEWDAPPAKARLGAELQRFSDLRTPAAYLQPPWAA